MDEARCFKFPLLSKIREEEDWRKLTDGSRRFCTTENYRKGHFKSLKIEFRVYGKVGVAKQRETCGLSNRAALLFSKWSNLIFIAY